MKAYGHQRKDMARCAYGCCGFKSVKEKNCRKLVDKSKRKSARQDGKVAIFTSLIEKEHNTFLDIIERD